MPTRPVVTAVTISRNLFLKDMTIILMNPVFSLMIMIISMTDGMDFQEEYYGDY